MKIFVRTMAAALVALSVTSCSKTDLFDEQAVQQWQKSAYEEGFKKAYPNVSPTQNWDLSTGQVAYSLPSSVTRAITRGNEATYSCSRDEFITEGRVSDYMHTNMKAGSNNVEKGTPFYMKVPASPFTIVPFYQGTASFGWELWMYVAGVGDIKVWSKGEGIEYQKTENGEWTAITASTSVPDDVAQIKSTSYTFSNLPVGADMYFYMKVKNGNKEFIVSSLNQMMLTLEEFPKPANLPEDNTAMIIGVEDNPNGDKDYEDLAFMVYGNPFPPKYRPKEVIEAKTKRYMMEDLGTTDDFDFNDVVADVEYDRVKKTLKYVVNEDGTESFTGEILTEEQLPTIAKIRAMGGTLDFNLTIGQTVWSKSSKFEISKMYNTTNINSDEILAEFEVTGYDAAANNVSVSVAGVGQSDAVMHVTFPKAGEIPMMIAVDPNQIWMKERISIPSTWWTE